jgi:hypothetical protein
MGGTYDKENAVRVSQDITSIIENGGCRFKETVMLGNPLDKTGKLRKVLGLRWDIEKDEICVDIKLNYGEKK